MSKKSYRAFLVLSICLSALACSSSQETSPPRPTQEQQPVPIVEIVQTANFSVSKGWETIQDIFATNGISIDEEDQPQGKIKTLPYALKDYACRGAYLERAPLDCHVTFKVSLQPLSPIASSLSLSYEERCLGQPNVVYACPGSNAEKLLKSIHREYARRSGIRF